MLLVLGGVGIVVVCVDSRIISMMIVVIRIGVYVVVDDDACAYGVSVVVVAVCVRSVAVVHVSWFVSFWLV